MHTPVRFALRCWLPAAAVLASIALAGPTRAAGAEGHEAVPVVAAGKSVAKVAAAKASAPGASAAGRAAPRDPMDVLRERLAQKLGAAKAPDGQSAYVVRVNSKADAPGAHPAAAPVRHRQSAAGGAATPHGGQAAAGHAAHWAYGGAGGPEAWAHLSPEFATCGSGLRQSPIDIRGGVRVDLEPVRFDYRPSSFNVLDNGHTVQVNVGAGNSIEVMGRRYELQQFHFHRPSEERIDGRQFDMVVHLVHRDVEGRLAVVAVLLERGSAQPLVQAVWNHLPLERGEADAVAVTTPLDLDQLLPRDRRYYTYMGSLTTPPCSEGVLWMVMAQPVPVSEAQIDVFARLYPMNARPIQSASGRLIKQSN